MHLDLAKLASIRKFVHRIKLNFQQIDILINNAGFYEHSPYLKFTKDGFEQHMGVNHLGHFLLTNLLMDLLKKGGGSR
jgi:NAD(P)-dependent dehydrogenase (short-subunit alcohol dehydrogenase family)